MSKIVLGHHHHKEMIPKVALAVLLINVLLGRLAVLLTNLLHMNTTKHPGNQAIKMCHPTMAMSVLILRSNTQTRGCRRMKQEMALPIAMMLPI
jgi:hypothetical protein